MNTRDLIDQANHDRQKEKGHTRDEALCALALALCALGLTIIFFSF
jgi:hypothetical protein